MNALSPHDRQDAWNRCLAARPGDLDLTVPPSAIEGTLPTALRGGRLLSNGPGWNVVGGVNVHPFDGHGYVRAFAFTDDGGVRLTARFVRTPTFEEEQAAGHLVRRALATNLPGGFWRNLGLGPPRNVANTTIDPWNGRWLAGFEAGAPYGIDPTTLATHGEETMGGALEGAATLAHTKWDPVRDRLVTCSHQTSRQTAFTVRAFDRDDQVVETHRASLPGMAFAHDFALSHDHVVLGGNPLKLRPLRLAGMLLGVDTLLRAVAVDRDAASTLLVIPRDGGPARTVTLPGPAWVVHFGNAFERDGDLIVDACVFDDLPFGEEFGYAGPHAPFDPAKPDARGPQRLVRITIPRDGDAATWRVLCPHGVDFPRFHPAHAGRDTPALFGATRADTRFSDPFDSVIRVDLHDLERPPTLWTAPDAFVGEPIFVPTDEHPTKGHVLALVSRGLADRTDLVVLDAEDLAAGPIATVPLPLLPVAFHGAWVDREA